MAPSESYLPVVVGGMLLGAGVGTAMAPASSALMGALPGEQAGVGSALNDTMQELGAAFGVAVLGTVVAATYRAHVPVGASAAVRRSLGDALGGVGDGSVDPALVATARSAYDVAMRQGLLVGAVAAAVGALAGWRLIGGRGNGEQHVPHVDGIGLEAAPQAG